MNRVRKIWVDRAVWFWKDAIQYLRIILTGYMYVPIISLILLSFLYHSLLQSAPASWNFGWLLGPLVALAVTRSPVRTFIRQPDLLFLQPMAHRLGEYFRLSLIYSGVVQGVILFFILLVLSPLYYAKISPSSAHFYIAFLLLLAVKWLNMLGAWTEYRIEEKTRVYHVIGRFILNLLLCLNLFKVSIVHFEFLWIFIASYFLYYVWLWNRTHFNWYHLVDQEGRSQMAFYSFVQWFMDVPQYPIRIKKRTLWVWLVQSLPIKTERGNGHFYLYVRSLIRYEDVFGHYLRLTFFGAMILFFVSESLLWTAAIYFLSLLSNAVQLVNAWNRLKYSFWDQIYPLPLDERKNGFRWAILVFLIFQSIVMSLSLVAHRPIIWLTLLTTGVLFSYITAYPVLAKKLRSH